MSEARRIEFLLARDGEAAARAWVRRTARIYRDALRASDYASSGGYRQSLIESVREFDDWLTARGERGPGGEEERP